MKVGLLGSGTVAQTLGKGFVSHGYEVMLGTRNPAKLTDRKVEAGNAAQVGSFKETAAFADILVLAVKGTAAAHVLEYAGAENLNGKTIIDATNPIADAPPEKGVIKFFTRQNESLMEELLQKYPRAHFVKAFSCVGAHLMVNPDFGGAKPTMFIAGNSENAKKVVIDILDQFGWETEDMGAAEAARAIEPLCILWCIPGISQNMWRHAFKLLKIE